MESFLKFLIVISFFSTLYANDAEYITSANTIVPLKSKDVRLDKEVLNIKYLKNGYFSVDVVYYLYNEGKSKDTVIGFEAPQPIGEDSLYNRFFYKPYSVEDKLNAEWLAINNKLFTKAENSGIENFKVEVNGKSKNYDIVDVSKLKEQKGSTPYVGYLYYFKTNLKHGLNKIHQQYTCITSGSVDNKYEFEYILATAKEWKGGKIADFTINIQLEKFADVIIYNTFFNNKDEWKWSKGKAITTKSIESISNKKTRFYIQDGKLIFHKKNFIPKSGLNLYSMRVSDDYYGGECDLLPYGDYTNKRYLDFFKKDYKSLKILKNLPYARRGYKFKTNYIASFYKKIPWYKEDKNYKADYNKLTQKEKDWLKEIEEFKLKIIRNLPFAKRGYDFKDENLYAYFKQYKWYKPNSNYQAKASDLSPTEKTLRAKVLNRKSISDKEFFKLLNGYLNQ